MRGAAERGGAVKIPEFVKCRSSHWRCAVGAVRICGAKSIKHFFRPAAKAGAQFEYCSGTRGPPERGRTIQVPQVVPDELAIRIATVPRAAESPEDGLSPHSSSQRRRQFEDNTVAGAAVHGRAVEISTSVEKQPCMGTGSIVAAEVVDDRFCPGAVQRRTKLKGGAAFRAAHRAAERGGAVEVASLVKYEVAVGRSAVVRIGSEVVKDFVLGLPHS